MSTIKVSTISPLGTDATKTITIGSAGDTIAGMGANTPAFLAYLSSDQTGVAHETYVKVNFNAEVFDTNSTFNTSTYRFTPGVAGKYFLFTQVLIEATNTADSQTLRKVQSAIYKNGSIITSPGLEYRLRGNDNGGVPDAEFDQVMATISGIVVADANDYFEVYGYGGNDNGSTERKFTANLCTFGGNRIIGA